jgi:ribosome maturation protein Sdo1
LKSEATRRLLSGTSKEVLRPKEKKMIKYLAKVLSFWDRFERVVVVQIPRTENERADALAQLGSATDEKILASKHWIITLDKPSMDETGSVMQI